MMTTIEFIIDDHQLYSLNFWLNLDENRESGKLMPHRQLILFIYGWKDSFSPSIHVMCNFALLWLIKMIVVWTLIELRSVKGRQCKFRFSDPLSICYSISRMKRWRYANDVVQWCSEFFFFSFATELWRSSTGQKLTKTVNWLTVWTGFWFVGLQDEATFQDIHRCQ